MNHPLIQHLLLISIELTSDEINQFKFGLHYSFLDKNKNIKKLIKLLIIQIVTNGKIFTSFYRLMKTKNVYATTDYTYKHLKRIIKDPNLVVISADKESCVIYYE